MRSAETFTWELAAAGAVIAGWNGLNEKEAENIACSTGILGLAGDYSSTWFMGPFMASVVETRLVYFTIFSKLCTQAPR